RRESLRGGKNVVPAAEAQRVADQVRAVHGEQGGVPDLQKHRDATLRGVALAQIRDLIFELPCARFGDLRAPGDRTDQANEAGNIGEAARLGDEDPDADALQTVDLQRRIAAAPGEHEIRPQGDQALDIHPPVTRDDRQALRLRRMAAEARDAGRSEEHTSELQSPYDLVCRLLLEKKKNKTTINHT